MGHAFGAGPYSRGPHAARKSRTAMPRSGPRQGMECAVGQRMDGASGQCGCVLLLRWARARLSRRENAAAASLRGAGTVVFASDGGLLGQCHGWLAVSLRQQGGRSGTDRHDREGYSPELFAELFQKRIAILTYHKFPKEDWPVEQFRAYRVELAGGQKVMMKLSERGTRLSNDLWLRQVRKLTDSGHQTAMLTTNFSAPMPVLAASMFARWCQENFFRYMREQYGLDRLVEYGTELVPDITEVVNPQWRRLDSQIRSKTGQRQRLHAKFGAMALSEGLSEDEVQTYERQKGELQEQIQHLDVEIDQLKQQRKQTQHHIPVQSLPEEERFTRLRTERKHFLDTIKMIAYRAETSLVSILREHLARSDDARTLVRQIFETEADLIPDMTNKTLTVQIHHLTQAAHDQVLEKLCAALNETQTVFPGTDLTLIFKIGSSQFPPGQEV